MTIGSYGRLVGFRDDVNLSLRWWHRLVKVLYSFIAGLVLLFLVWVTVEGGSSNLEPIPSRVRIVRTFGDYLRQADTSQANVLPAFLRLPGELGLLKDGGASIERLYAFEIDEWWCTPNITRDAAAIASYLTQQSYGRRVTTSQEVLADVEDRSRSYCFFASDRSVDDVSAVIKYEFTSTGYAAGLWDGLSDILFWFLVVHLGLSLLYYRGVVYVICGPRRAVPIDSHSDREARV